MEGNEVKREPKLEYRARKHLGGRTGPQPRQWLQMGEDCDRGVSTGMKGSHGSLSRASDSAGVDDSVIWDGISSGALYVYSSLLLYILGKRISRGERGTLPEERRKDAQVAR